MSSIPNEEQVGLFFELVNRRDLARLGDLLAEDAEFYFPKTKPLIGRDRIIKFFNILFRRFPRLRFQVQGQVVQGDRAAVHWTNEGVNRDGEAYQNEGMTLLEISSGKIRYISDFFKDTGKF
ncbi:MAG: nuclear transport factor 2 family protein [Deltaproteobacteria bacterium]|nr:nuclear transport factor 2 family protein [Deltaproteobacteria bacterium]